MADDESQELSLSDTQITNRVKFRRRDIPGLLARYGIAIGLIAYIVSRVDTVDFSRLYELSFLTVAYLLAIKLVVYGLMAVRLRIILRESHIQVPVAWVLGINHIGLLISYLTPSSVLSDIGKIYFFRVFKKNTVGIFVGIFLDRVVGLLCILAVLAAASTALYLQNPQGFWRIFIGATLIKTGILAGGVVTVFLLPVLFWKMGFFKKFIVKHFSFLTASLGLKISTLSILSHLVYCLLVLECARWTATVPLTYTDTAIVFPMSAIATAVPTTPGSIGVGQVVYKYLVDVLTMTSTDTGILLFTLLQLLDIPFLLWGLVSGLILILRRTHFSEATKSA